MKGLMAEYLQGLKGYIKFSIQLLVFSLIVGVYVAAYHAKETQQVVDWAASSLSPGVSLSGLQLFFFIFENNVTALFYSLAESIVFGISPILMIVANGVIIGVFMVLVTKKASFMYFILGILPHGIFEIPAAIISSSMGMRVGSAVILKLRRKKTSIVGEIYNALKYFILVVVPLLFIAALIEAFITPAVLSLA